MNGIVTCGQCRHFIRPEPRFEPNSMGSCGLYDDWRAKWGGKTIPLQADNRVNAELGNKMFFTDIERYCTKFHSLI